MNPITEEQFLAMNSYIIKYDDDNRPGIRDGAGSDIYFQLEAINYETDPIMKASLSIYTANSHIFNNGNKRTAFALADIVLGEYGYYIDVERDELISFSCWVAGIDPNAISKEDVIEEIVKWIKTKMRRLEL
jgi:death-on-curing family protein